MSEKKPNGGPAFPGIATYEDGLKSYSNEIHGMSLRDYFAASSLVGILQLHGFITGGSDKAAQMAYSIADSLLAEREK